MILERVKSLLTPNGQSRGKSLRDFAFLRENPQSVERINMGMTPELQKYYENRFDLFSHPAWNDLMEDVQNMLNASNTLDGATPDNVEFKKGEISIMRWILSLKKTTEDAYEGLTNANN